MRFWLALLILAPLAQLATWPRALPAGALAVPTSPSGARVLRTQAELFVAPSGQASGGQRRILLGRSPGPLALDPADLPVTLEFELPGYHTLTRTFAAGSLTRQRPVYPERLELRPVWPGMGLLYAMRDFPSVPLAAAGLTGLVVQAVRRRRGQRELAGQRARHRRCMFEPGDRVGEWLLEERLGSGGAGQVFRASSGGRRVALKLLFGAVQRAAFEAEVRAWKALRHPGIVFLEGWGEWEGQHYLVLELIDGESLEQRLTGSLPEAECRSLGLQVARALQAVHAAGVVHRDLKPANLLVERSGRIRLSDFGLACAAGTGGSMAGTPGYLAPEAFEGEPDYAADVYALGVVLYRCLAGRLPFAGSSVIETMSLQQAGRRDPAPGEWEALLRGMLAPDPGCRPGLGDVVTWLEKAPP